MISSLRLFRKVCGVFLSVSRSFRTIAFRSFVDGEKPQERARQRQFRRPFGPPRQRPRIRFPTFILIGAEFADRGTSTASNVSQPPTFHSLNFTLIAFRFVFRWTAHRTSSPRNLATTIPAMTLPATKSPATKSPAATTYATCFPMPDVSFRTSWWGRSRISRNVSRRRPRTRIRFRTRCSTISAQMNPDVA